MLTRLKKNFSEKHLKWKSILISLLFSNSDVKHLVIIIIIKPNESKSSSHLRLSKICTPSYKGVYNMVLKPTLVSSFFKISYNQYCSELKWASKSLSFKNHKHHIKSSLGDRKITIAWISVNWRIFKQWS